jgi:hypothetical protein
VVLFSVTGNTPKHKLTPTATSTGPSRHHPTTPAFNAADYTVAVLNGTSVNGLAKAIATELTNHGFKQGAVTNAVVQTQTTTVVGFLPGDQTAAAQVAKDLKLSANAVQAAGQAAIVACAESSAPAGSTQTSTSCPASVIVTVGADLANSASNT